MSEPADGHACGKASPGFPVSLSKLLPDGAARAVVVYILGHFRPLGGVCRQSCHKTCSSKSEFMAVAGIVKVQIAVCADRLKMGPCKHNNTRCLRADGPSFSAEGFLNRYRNSWSAAYHAHKAMIEELSRRRGRPTARAAPALPVSELALPVPLSRFQWPLVRTSRTLGKTGTGVLPDALAVIVAQALAVHVAWSLLGSERRPPCM